MFYSYYSLFIHNIQFNSFFIWSLKDEHCLQSLDGRHGCERMLVGFITTCTYATSAYHH
jgi:hypothetical protein